MNSNNKDQENTKEDLEIKILIIKIIMGVLLASLGFFLSKFFTIILFIFLAYWFLSGLIVPLIPVYILFRSKLKEFGGILRIIFYGYPSYTMVFILIWGFLFLLDSFF